MAELLPTKIENLRQGLALSLVFQLYFAEARAKAWCLLKGAQASLSFSPSGPAQHHAS
jgi:hypothetical protein